VQTTFLRSLFSVVELALGLTLIALGSYSLLSNQDCPPEAHDCVGWGLLAAAMFLPPGVLIAAAGVLSYSWRRFPLVPIQLILIGALISYFFLAGFE